ncbi:Piso0_001451 [Millerozyma farinosa CBS 7064]|uniref:Piso0_001451 protein n=1 Tax=Pichia sorbitophila (strain ATCC MYA-4447 / BCRC 22081 / CBS 7064 / NBRC 10061 / NRRL Y-12695) TaxID=559304 RepID=G8YKU0_PICSO|nr:Piso0_001451 [Millerozyma farinosa CBS 7064]
MRINTFFISILHITLSLLVSFPTATHGLFHFYMNHGQKRCFNKELVRGSLFIGRYKVELYDDSSEQYFIPNKRTDVGVIVDVEEKFFLGHKVVHQKGSTSGQFVFNTLQPGNHEICFTPRSFRTRKWYQLGQSDPADIRVVNFKTARLSLDFLIGDSNVISSSSSDQFRSLIEQVNRLNDKLTDVRREQQFIKNKEESFRDLSERTCEHVVRWSLVQLSALFITCIYQLFSLHRYFTKVKKD